MIDRMNYVQTAARVKVKEKKLLNKAKLNRMIDADSALDILKILSETDYSKSMAGVSDNNSFEEILKNESERVYKFATDVAKDCQDCVKVFKLKGIFQNLKLTLKNKIKGESVEEIDEEYLGEYDLAMKEYEKNKDVQAAVILLDRLYFERLEKLCKKLDLEILNEYFKLSLNSYNLLTFLRLKNQKRSYKYAKFCIFFDDDLLRIYEQDSNYIASLEKYFDDKNMWSLYQKDQKISVVEKVLENKVVELIRKYKNINYGIEPVITYILAKEYEMKAIRLIMTGKINKIPNEVIKERLREIYV
ncbi:V-type ATPase subunit [Sneathia vaginalis]|uniref:V-type ATPase subunit n=1 Tax=Sneathia vaginalis TaxID=187101 RepID=UPI002593AC00|nr:V-type ATPase subunit [uncultured Sneathia sp.]